MKCFYTVAAIAALGISACASDPIKPLPILDGRVRVPVNQVVSYPTINQNQAGGIGIQAPVVLDASKNSFNSGRIDLEAAKLEMGRIEAARAAKIALARPPTMPNFVIDGDKTLETTLNRWAKLSNYPSVIWQRREPVPVKPSSTTYDADFVKALSAIVNEANGAGLKIKVQIFSDKTVVIKDGV